jgi:hypothetical protein
MDYEETLQALLRLRGDEVQISLWERQSDGLTFRGSDPPAVVRMFTDTVVVDPTTFDFGEWRDDPEPSSLWILQGDQATVVTPVPD